MGDHWLWWNLTNTGEAYAAISQVDISWPSVSGKLKKMKLDGDVFADPPDTSPPNLTMTAAEFHSDIKKRRIAPGETRTFTVEFEKNSHADLPSDYSIDITFENGHVESFN